MANPEDDPTLAALMDITCAYVAYRLAEGDDDTSPAIEAALAAIERATGPNNGWPDNYAIKSAAVTEEI